MAPARVLQISADITAGDCVFRATGQKVIFPGFTRVFRPLKDEREALLPKLDRGETLELAALTPTQRFTLAPPRFSDASLVRTMEESGIGRPSTYVPVVETLLKRYYVSREKRQFHPTVLGDLINGLLTKYFPVLLDVSFTAGMEEQLDGVEEARIDWVKLLRDFFGPFKLTVERAEVEMKNMKGIFDVVTDEVCEQCGKPMVKKIGRFGFFLACSGFPECRNSKALPLADCPEPGCGGKVVKKRARGRRGFYGCTKYPSCRFVTWDKPIDQKCPRCGKFLVERTARGSTQLLCVDMEKCGYHVEAADEPNATAGA
jgi:DNA topoisomerase-1